MRRIIETVRLLVDDFSGPHRRLILGYLLLSVLFLLYVYGGKNAFLKGSGYGIPALVSDNAGNRELYRLQRRVVRMPRGEARRSLQERINRLRADTARHRRASATMRRMIPYAGWFASGFFFLFVLPVLVIRFTPGLRFGDFGLGLGDWRLSLRVFALFMGIMLAAVVVLLLFRAQGFLRYYPMYAKGMSAAGQLGPGWFLLMEFLYLLYFIGWEFYFRALLLFPLEKHLGALTPLVGVLPFAIMHLGKPVPEVFGSVIAAYFLGVVVLKSRSFWICPVIHFLIAFSMDLAAVLHRGLL